MHQKVALWLKWVDKVFIVIPLIFILRSIYSENEILVALVDTTILKSLFAMFTYNTYLFTSLSIFLFFFATLYRNTFRVYANEWILAEGFHSVNHRHRNFVDGILEYKKEHGIFHESLLGEHSDVLKQKYHELISALCHEARRLMAKIINDQDCYVTVKLLVEEDETSYVLQHHQAWPPEIARGKHLTGVLLPKNSVDNPLNLFQVIINSFNSISSGEKEFQTWNFGLLCNDLKGESRFDRNLIGGNFSRYKASIIIPLTIDYALVGFFCFNTKRIGMLREKHRHFLAGFCDEIANALRNIIH